ncbi:MAG: helix-turn-helix transcriptional regulator [Candidatus Kapaibacterium sp.]|nr:helix-turn-helix transcriptional regulator [Ignavibacteria bacterium]
MSFNTRLKEIIEKDYTSQVQLANELGVSKAVITKYLNTDRKPNFEMLEKFYNIGYNINWLVSGRGTQKRHLINREELDKIDRLVFGIDELEYSGIKTIMKPMFWSDSEYSTTKNIEVEVHLASSIKRYFYLNNSFKLLNYKLNISKYTLFLRENIITNNNTTFYSLVEAPILSIIETNINFDGFEPKLLPISNKVNKSIFIKNLSCYIFLQTELDYYNKSIEQYKKIVYNESSSVFFDFLSLIKADKNENDNNLSTISFNELKERFTLLLKVFDNYSYLESKSLIYSGMIDKIFKIEQSNN